VSTPSTSPRDGVEGPPVARLLRLGFRIAHRQALARGMLHYEDELCGVAASALARAIAGYDSEKGEIVPFAAEWMYQEVAHAIKDERKRASREVPVQDVEAPRPQHPALAVEELAGDTLDALFFLFVGEELITSGEAKLLTREAVAQLHREIAELDAAERQLVTLRYWDDLTWREVAAELGIAEATAKQRDARLRARLRDALIAWDRVRPLRRRT
jgi:RNA polymerase sigma factor (sigma-70 family)